MTTYPTGIVKSLLGSVDSILGVRDKIGAVIQPVYFLTRIWYKNAARTVPATQPEGYAMDSVVQCLPSPGMKQFSQDVRIREGGAIKAGDIILTNISRNKYKVSDLDGSTKAANVEKLFVIGDKVYQVINVTEKYVTLDAQVRELTNQARY